MEYYSRDSLREYRNQSSKKQTENSSKPSKFLSFIIVALIVGLAIFCYKTGTYKTIFNYISNIKNQSASLGQMTKDVWNSFSEKISNNKDDNSTENTSGQSSPIDIGENTVKTNAFNTEGNLYIKSLFLTKGLSFCYQNPIVGSVSSPFGYRIDPINNKKSFHKGVDIASEKGTIITAFADGKVIDVGKNDIYGNYVLIEHNSTYKTFYGHLSKVIADKGESLKMGQLIGIVGTTGRSTGIHLHFELRENDKQIDPIKYLNYEN